MPRGAVLVIELEGDGEIGRDVVSARWVRLETEESSLPGVFVAQVSDDSMEPRFPSGGYGLFRRPAPGNRQGRVFLVTFRDRGGVRQRGLKYVEKGVFSGRERIVLRSLNPARGPVLVDPVADDFRIVGELVRAVVVQSGA
jgi:phage repressor protein C with HTH and peptisase S24 domain